MKHVVGANVKRVMAAKKLSQPQVALLSKQHGHNIDQTTVGRIARAEIPTTVEKLDAIAAGLGVEAWQLLVPDLDPGQLPRLGAELDPGEQDLLTNYRGAGERWKISLRYMAGLRTDSDQEEVASGVNMLLAKILGSKPYPVSKMGPGWKKPGAHILHDSAVDPKKEKP